MQKKHHIIKLIEQGEHQQLDFKFAINDSKKIARSLSAFANTDGGRLLIGVKDNGSIAGVRSEEEYHMIEAASQLYTRPEVKFETLKHNINGKQVLEVIIEKSKNRPHFAPDEKGKMKAFVRVKDQNLLANGLLLKVWEQQKKETGVKIKYNDAEKLILKYLSENDYITFSKFKKLANITKNYAEKILVDFIVLDIIEIVISDSLIFYRMKDSKFNILK
ncbi:MAG: ATP-binding protein [Chlorobi bacterium]|nr:ATP-binding protein [Chlorobiota bacterium]